MNYEQRDPIPIHMISLFAGATDELEGIFNFNNLRNLLFIF